MPRFIVSILLLLGVLAARAAESRVIAITTARSALTLAVASDGRLYQLDYGRARERPAPTRPPAREDEAHPPAGNGYILEPALQATHADGNTSTELAFVSSETGPDP